MFEDETRLRNLSSRAIEGVITDEEFSELIQLSKAKRKSQKDRAALLFNFRETFDKHSITIHDLFSASDIAAAISSKRIGVVDETTAKPKRRQSGVRSARFQFKNGPVLIEISVAGKRGFACRYCKGQPLPGYVSKSFKLLDDGQLETNLARYYTAEGQEYFATVDGSVELARLLNYIKTHQVKPQLR
ncbi:MAG: hypothetical protein IPG23_11215 [Burkholderiales bacterium]|nr:hypothetical protein [Burkholderiales bacterium]